MRRTESGIRSIVMLAALALPTLTGCLDRSDPAATGSDLSPVEPPLLACADPCDVQVPMGLGKAFEPDVAVSPLDDRHAVIGQTPIRGEPASLATRAFEVHVTRDGGASWSTTWSSEPHAADPLDPFFGCTVFADAIVAFLPDGALLVGGLAGRGVQTLSLFVMRSDDGGVTFPSVAWVEPAAPGATCGATPAPEGQFIDSADKPEIATAPDGSAVVLWHRLGLQTQTPTPPLVLSFSDDGGRTWSDPEAIEEIAGSLGVYPQLTDRQTLGLASWQEGDGYAVALTEDGGATWNTSLVVAATANNYPGYARVETSNGTAHLAVYPEAADGGYRAMLAVSWDQGATWNRTALSQAGPQLPMPNVDARGGTAYLSYWSSGETAISRQVVAWRDGVLGVPVAVDGATRPERHEMTPTGYGHYMGLAAFPGGAYAAWGAGPPLQASLHAARVELV